MTIPAGSDQKKTMRAWTVFPAFGLGIYRADQREGCQR